MKKIMVLMLALGLATPANAFISNEIGEKQKFKLKERQVVTLEMSTKIARCKF
jgi:hypothetical protein